MGDAWRGNNRGQSRGNRGQPNGGRGGGGRGGNQGNSNAGRGGGNQSYRGGSQEYSNGVRGGGGGWRGGRGRGAYQQNPANAVPNGPSYGEGMTYPLMIKPGSKAYRNYVKLEYIFEKGDREITKEITETRKKNDTRYRMLCYQCMAKASSIKFSGTEYAYDNMHTLYTTKPIEKFVYEFADDVPAPIFRECLGPIPKDEQGKEKKGKLVMTVEPTKESVDLCDLKQYQNNTILLQEDHSLRTVLEMIINDTTLATGDFSLARCNDIYRVAENPIERGLCTRQGTKKGVRIIKKDDKYLPALVVDVVHSPFYASEGVTTFYDLVKRFVGDPRKANWDEATRFFKGIKVYPKYAQHRVLQCKGFTPQPVRNIKISMEDGKKVPMAQFYKSKKEITLRDLDMPAMIPKNTDAGEFPLETLYVVPSQLVDLDAVPNYLRENVHRRNAVPPQQRHDEIQQEVAAMEINGPIGRAFGIDAAAPIKNVSQLLFELPAKPKIQLGGGGVVIPEYDGRFSLDRGHYLLPATVNRMALMAEPRDLGLAQTFLKRFVDNGKSRGMKFPALENIDVETIQDPSCYDKWEAAFENFKKRGITFVLMVGSGRNPHSKKFLKLCESQYKIVTQLVSNEVIRPLIERNQNITLSNILHKTNVKNGGLNYKPLFEQVGERLDINKGKVLVIAYDVSHPGELDSALPQNHRDAADVGKFPSVVGLVANVIKEPSAFVGNFFYQESRKEAVITPVFGTYLKKMLTQLRSHGRSMPTTVVVLRDGVSEGQFGMVLRDELPLIRQTCLDINSKWKPDFLVAIVTKRHHKRFVKNDLTNAPVGSFVTDKVVRPDCTEFFMACHKALRGTTKFVQVSIIHNELKATTEELKPFLHSLSYGHQIVTSPVSLPTPVYQADDMATRGREVLQTLRHQKPRDIPMTDANNVDYEKLSGLLSYFDSPLATRRCNA